MRLIVFFDLPTLTVAERKAYSNFRKNLINEGFIMMQESVYTKLLLNQGMADLLLKRIRKHVPSNGLIQSLLITEKQFAGIDNLCGESKSNKLSITDRVILL